MTAEIGCVAYKPPGLSVRAPAWASQSGPRTWVQSAMHVIHAARIERCQRVVVAVAALLARVNIPVCTTARRPVIDAISCSTGYLPRAAAVDSAPSPHVISTFSVDPT
jgi:hypothetical protein